MKPFASIALLLAGLLFLPVQAHAQDSWAVPGAKLRYRLSLENPPTTPECGYFFNLPDGGLLGGKPPVTTAIAKDGRKLRSQLMWHSPERGFDLVIEDPGVEAKTLDVYISETGKPDYWTPSSPLKPGTILCTLQGTDSMAAARGLTKFSPLPNNLVVSQHKGIPKAAISIGGDLLGRPAPWVFYLMGNVVAKSAGEFWMVPMSKSGTTVTLVNGQEITPTNQMPGWGGIGAFVPLQQGLNRIEFFQTASQAAEWLCFLAWAPPYEQFRKPVQNARGVVATDIARSGNGQVSSIERADGAPVAAAKVESGFLYWTGNELPLVTADLVALSTKNPPDTTYTWNFSDGSTATGPRVSRIFPAMTMLTATLTAKSPQGVSKSTFQFCPSPFDAANLNNLSHLLAYQNAVDSMLSESPTDIDPIPQWGEAHWNNFIRTLGGSKEAQILSKLFKKHSATMARQLSADQYLWLQDRLLDGLQDSSPDETLRWIDALSKSTKNADRLQVLKLREAESLARGKGDIAKAKAILEPIAASNSTLAPKAIIRLGDIAFMQGDLNEATSRYSRAQALARANRKTSRPATSVYDAAFANIIPSDAPPATPAAPAATPAAPVKTPSAFDTMIKNREETKGLKKSGALQEVSLSENVRSLLKGGLKNEAGEVLEAWEVEFPLSKVSGDYIMRESEWNIATGKHARAYPMLAAYCTLIDASSFLPDAATLLIECSSQLPDTKEQTRVIIKSILDRMKYHPVAASLEEYLKQP